MKWHPKDHKYEYVSSEPLFKLCHIAFVAIAAAMTDKAFRFECMAWYDSALSLIALQNNDYDKWYHHCQRTTNYLRHRNEMKIAAYKQSLSVVPSFPDCLKEKRQPK